MRIILVVEDDSAIAEGVQRTLESEGFHVELAGNGVAALEWLAHRTPDLIIADIMMPSMNGYQLYQRVRQNPDWVWIPFIFLTAKADLEDIRFAKELGADDYLVKPIEPQDLVAAVWGRLTRYDQLEASSGAPSPKKSSGQYEVGNLRVDLSRREVVVDRQDVKLSPTEFDILQRLILAGGAVVLYEDLLGYDEGDVLGERDAAELLRYHVRNLRQKIKAAGEDAELIVNVRSVGYRLATQPSRPGTSP
jgi:DNA-binding response OmpR family regulator